MVSYLAERLAGLDGKVDSLTRELRIHWLNFHPDADTLCRRVDDEKCEVRPQRRATFDVRAFDAHHGDLGGPPFWTVLAVVVAIAASFAAGLFVGSTLPANPIWSSPDRGSYQYRYPIAPPEPAPLQRSAPPGGSPDAR
jgi:hypothetical protein